MCKFLAFMSLGSGEEVTHYDEITEGIQIGRLTYWHYNVAPSSSATYNVFPEKRTVDIFDMTEFF